MAIALDAFLPELRSDLVFREAPREADGSPAATIEDPSAGRYHRVGWKEGAILRRLRPGLTLGRLVEELRREAALGVAPEEVAGFCEKAVAAGLTRTVVRTEALLARREAGRESAWRWLVRRYLYFRLPLWAPQEFLAAALPRVLPLASPTASAAFVLCALSALILLPSRFDEFAATFVRSLTWHGALFYAAAWLVAKTVHEFAHAFAACARGVPVRTMGLAFLVFWPVPYSDITDAWRLPDRRSRFAIGAAGLRAELSLAALCLFLWCVSPDGPFRAALFTLSSVTLAASLLVNLNPAMRFDGYFLLSEAWGVENLRARAAAWARWLWRRTLLGIEEPAPEAGVPRRRRPALAAYAAASFLYRIVLYTGIAIFVYLEFPKALGVILFAVEVWVFLAAPFAVEGAALWRDRRKLRPNRRLGLTVAALGMLLVWLAAPLPRTLSLPCRTVADAQVLYAPRAGKVVEAIRGPGPVGEGALLCRIESPELVRDRTVLEREIAVLETQRRILDRQEGGEAMLAENRRTAAKAEAELERLRMEERRCAVRVRGAGMLHALPDGFVDGFCVSVETRLGEVVDPSKIRLVAYAREREVRDCRAGTRVACLEAGAVRRISGTVRSVTAVSALPEAEIALCSVGGGPLPAEEEGGRLQLLEACYRLEIEPDPGAVLHPGRSGTVRLFTESKSLLVEYARFAWSVLVRESGF